MTSARGRVAAVHAQQPGAARSGVAHVGRGPPEVEGDGGGEVVEQGGDVAGPPGGEVAADGPGDGHVCEEGARGARGAQAGRCLSGAPGDGGTRGAASMLRRERAQAAAHSRRGRCRGGRR